MDMNFDEKWMIAKKWVASGEEFGMGHHEVTGHWDIDFFAYVFDGPPIINDEGNVDNLTTPMVRVLDIRPWDHETIEVLVTPFNSPEEEIEIEPDWVVYNVGESEIPL